MYCTSPFSSETENSNRFVVRPGPTGTGTIWGVGVPGIITLKCPSGETNCSKLGSAAAPTPAKRSNAAATPTEMDFRTGDLRLVRRRRGAPHELKGGEPSGDG